MRSIIIVIFYILAIEGYNVDNVILGICPGCFASFCGSSGYPDDPVGKIPMGSSVQIPFEDRLSCEGVSCSIGTGLSVEYIWIEYYITEDYYVSCVYTTNNTEYGYLWQYLFVHCYINQEPNDGKLPPDEYIDASLWPGILLPSPMALALFQYTVPGVCIGTIANVTYFIK